MIMAGRIHSKILPLSTTGGVGVGSGANYDDDDEEEGLDVTIMGALRWYHYYCAGYKRKPRKNTKFTCSHCR